MPKSYYLPANDDGKDPWLANFAAKLANYQPVLGLTLADVLSVSNDAAYYHWMLTSQMQVAAYAQQWTAYKNAGRNGTGLTLGAAPIAPSLGVPPPAVAANIFGRVILLVARIKVAPGYTDAIGQALEIIGADHTVDVNSLKPVLRVEQQAGGVAVLWAKQGMDGVELLVDRGTGFVFLAIDTIPDYTDTAALPAAGQSALWKYKGIYRQGDDRVGQWSDVVSVAVAG